jgi:hypothetical protein
MSASSAVGRLFKHTRLREWANFRILTLEPAACRDDKIIVSLAEVSSQGPLEPQYAYEALSYTWGSPHGTIPIICGNQTLLVTPNCHGALTQFRLADKPRKLWVDAICIDQGADEEARHEREWQIMNMRYIYKRAECVIIWLGSPSSGLEAYHALFQRLTETAASTASPRHSLSSADDVNFDVKPLPGSTPGLSSPEWKVLIRLLSLPWFLRVWTLQEVAFAVKCSLFYGPATIEWDVLCSAFTRLITLVEIDSDQFQQSCVEILHLRLALRLLVNKFDTTLSEYFAYSVERLQARRTIFKQLKTHLLTDKPAWHPVSVATPDGVCTNFDLEGLGRQRKELVAKNLSHNLAGIKHLQVTLKADKLFGVYGILMMLPLPLVLPRPDYSMPIEVVAAQSVVLFMLALGSTDILQTCIRGLRSTSGTLPSWVPDFWPNAEAVSCSRLVSTNIWKHFEATGGSAARLISWSHGSDRYELRVAGKVVGRIAQLVGKQLPARFRRAVVNTEEQLQAGHGGLNEPPVSQVDDLKDIDVLRIQSLQSWVRLWKSRTPQQDSEEWDSRASGVGIDDVRPLYDLLRTMTESATLAMSFGTPPASDGTRPGIQYTSFIAWYDLMRYPDCQMIDLSGKHLGSLEPADALYELLGPRSSSYAAMGEEQLEFARAFHHSLDDMGTLRLFRPDTGTIGVTDECAMEGDCLALISGNAAPMILRPVDGKFEVVAPAYLDGAMDGRLWKNVESHLETITLV